MRKAFTLIEILIVVVILGILAAIVIPQFTQASTDAQIGNVKTQLNTIKNQIEMYRVRNNGNYPFSATALVWTPLVGANYLRQAPVNPRTNSSAVATGTDHTGGAATDGWIWNDTSKRMYAKFFDEAANGGGGGWTN
jgi:general secretion pathway protein G